MPRETVEGKLTVETPAAGAGTTIKAIDWAGVTDTLKAKPNVWMRLHHTYITERAVRSSVGKAALRHGFAYQVTRSRPQPNGMPGVFLMWKEEE